MHEDAHADICTNFGGEDGSGMPRGSTSYLLLTPGLDGRDQVMRAVPTSLKRSGEYGACRARRRAHKAATEGLQVGRDWSAALTPPTLQSSKYVCVCLTACVGRCKVQLLRCAGESVRSHESHLGSPRMCWGVWKCFEPGAWDWKMFLCNRK